MLPAFRLRAGVSIVVLVSFLVGVGVWVLLAGEAVQPRLRASARLAELRPTGSPQLVSIEPLPEMEVNGEMCQWVPASSQTRLMALLQEETPGPLRFGLRRWYPNVGYAGAASAAGTPRPVSDL